MKLLHFLKNNTNPNNTLILNEVFLEAQKSANLQGGRETSTIQNRIRQYIKNKKLRPTETGRSMVEMLGVLAIIGVLSIGGILGYKYAMIKYTANQIVNEMDLISTQAAAVILRPYETEYELSFGNPYDIGHLTSVENPFYFGCGVDAEMEEPCQPDETTYYQIVEDLSADLCRALVQMVEVLPYMIDVEINNVRTGATAADCTKENNVLTVYFDVEDDATLEGRPEIETEPECNTNEDCEGSYGAFKPICETETGKCVGCVTDADCQSFEEAPICLKKAGKKRGHCIKCINNDDCIALDPEFPICLDHNACIQCLTSRDCNIIAGKPKCNRSVHLCEACPGEKIYNAETDTCVCPPEKPIPDGTGCSECRDNSHCARKGANYYCFIPNECSNKADQPHNGVCRTGGVAKTNIEFNGKKYLRTVGGNYYTVKNICEINHGRLLKKQEYIPYSGGTPTALGVFLRNEWSIRNHFYWTSDGQLISSNTSSNIYWNCGTRGLSCDQAVLFGYCEIP